MSIYPVTIQESPDDLFQRSYGWDHTGWEKPLLWVKCRLCGSWFIHCQCCGFGEEYGLCARCQPEYGEE